MIDHYPTPKNVAGLFGYLLMVSVVSFVVLKLISRFTFQFNDSFIQILAELIAYLLVSKRYLKKKREINQENYFLRTEKIRFTSWALILGLLVLMSIIVTPILNLIPVPDWFIKIMKEVISDDRYSFLSVVVVAPVFEEIIMRGIILDGFLKRYDPKKAILYSSLIFGIIHLNPWQFIDAFIGGVYIGWIYHRTRSIIPCIAIHALNNLIAFSMSLLPEGNILTKNPIVGNWPLYMLFILLAGILFYYGIQKLDKKLEEKPVESGAELGSDPIHFSEE